MVRYLPHQQKSISNILISAALVSIDYLVHDLSDGIDKHHDLLLQHLGGPQEVMDVAKAKYGTLFPAWQHGVQVTLLGHVLCYYFTPCLTKP
jgi:hypothetical protein